MGGALIVTDGAAHMQGHALTLLGKSWWAIFHAIVGSVGSAMSSRALAVAGQRQNRRSGRFDVTTRVHVARHAGDYT
jgi:hypothetical protein